MHTKQHTVDAEEDGIRLDRWLKRHYPEFSHGLVQKSLRKGLIRLDGKKVEASARIASGQIIELRGLEGGEGQPKPRASIDPGEARDLQKLVLFKNQHVLIINKPQGLAVQGGSKLREHLDGKLQALQFDAKEPPKLVHRLDKDTSGVLALGRSSKAASELTRAFATRSVKKLYWALIMGVPEKLEGTINLAIEKQEMRDAEERMVVDENGKKSITRYRVVDVLYKKLAWVEMMPVTGRTHQLRVHMAAIGHPIVGDGKYGGESAFPTGMELPASLHLHARRLVIDGLFGARIDVNAPLPAHMKESWQTLGLDEQEGASRWLDEQ